MWQQYLKKTVVVKELEEERGFSNNPIALTVLAIKQIELNEMALVASIRGDIYWAYCSKYIVLSVEECSDINATWYNYIGKSILVTSLTGTVEEVMPLQARGIYSLIKYKFIDLGNSCKWVNTNDYTVRNQMF